jgi:hypothetical protein
VKYGDKLVTKEVLNVTPHPGYERNTTLLHVAVKSGRKVKIGTKTGMLAMFKDLQIPPRTPRAKLLRMLRTMRPEAKSFYVKRNMTADLEPITDGSAASSKLRASDMILWE